MLGKKKRPSGLSYNTQAKRNQAATMNLLSALEGGGLGGEGNTKLQEAVEASKRMLEEPEKKYRGKAKVAASKAATSTNDSQSESSPSGKMEVLYCILLMFVLMIILYYVDC